MKIQTIAILLFVLLSTCGQALSEIKPQDPAGHHGSSSDQQNVPLDLVAPAKTTFPNVAPLSAQPDNAKQKEEANSQAESNKIVIYTLWLTVFTGLMVFISALMYLSTKKLSAIAQREFYATHRPRIIVLTMKNLGRVGDEIIPQFTYVNAGGSDAKVTDISTSVFFAEILHPGTPLVPQKFNPTEILAPGERAAFDIPSGFSQKTSVINEMKNGRGQPSENLFCVGVVSYENTVGDKMETGFIRQFDGSSNLWLKMNNSDYEYNY